MGVRHLTMSGLGTKQLILLPALLGMNYIDFETPNTVNMVITGYVTMQAITLSICFMVYRSIESKRGQQGHTQRFLVKAPPLPFGQENPAPDKMMNATEYDISKLNEIVKQILMGICVISFIFYKWESPKPLFLQMLMAPSAILESQLFQIHIRGKPATGELIRPWKPPPGMMDELKKSMEEAQQQAATGGNTPPAAVQQEQKPAAEAKEEEEADEVASDEGKKKEIDPKTIDYSTLEQVD